MSDDELNFAAQNRVTELARQRKDTLTMPWLGSTAAIALYAIVVVIVAGSGRVEAQVAVTVVFGALAVGLAVASIVLPQRRLTDQLLLKHLRQPLNASRNAARMKLDSAQSNVYTALPESEQRIFALTIAFERPYLEALIMTGGVALLGLAHGLIAMSFDGASPFLGAALALNCWHYPRLTRIIDRGRKLYRKAEEEDEVRRALAKKSPGPQTSRRPSPARSSKS